jgi:thymidylate kinase
MAAMDEGAARALLAEVAGAAGDAAILWRGAELDGSDVDVLVLPEALAAVHRVLADAGLRPALSDPGHLMWTSAGGGDLAVDVLSAARWPEYYPSLDGVRRRSEPGGDGPPVASAADRLLILGGEAVAGRPLAKVLRRVRPLLATPGAREQLAAVAAEERLEALAALVVEPDRLARRERRGRLTYPAAVLAALRSAAARRALGERLAARATRSHRRPSGGVLVTLSGMDGAGKSTFTAVAAAHLTERGLAVRDEIVRIGRRGATLDRIAVPVKRLLRHEGSTADPVAAGDETAKASGRPPAESPRSGIGWIWTVVVGAENALACRRIARARRHSNVVTDRWAADHLVDFELRYGRHPLGTRILRAGVPRADLGILLQITAETSAERKPGDQAPAVLARMEGRYAELAPQLGLIPIDARAPRAQVEAIVLALVDSLLAERAG